MAVHKHGVACIGVDGKPHCGYPAGRPAEPHGTTARCRAEENSMDCNHDGDETRQTDPRLGENVRCLHCQRWFWDASGRMVCDKPRCRRLDADDLRRKELFRKYARIAAED